MVVGLLDSVQNSPAYLHQTGYADCRGVFLCVHVSVFADIVEQGMDLDKRACLSLVYVHTHFKHYR